MPQSLRTAVYKAELSFQKELHSGIVYRRSVRRMKCLNRFLKATLPLMIVLAVALTVYTCYANSDMIGRINFSRRFAAMVPQLAAVAEKITAIDPDPGVLAEKLRFVPERLMDPLKELLRIPDLLFQSAEKLGSVSQRLYDAVMSSACQITYFLQHAQERIAIAAEYVQTLIHEFQK